jgi:hypothetical protein
MKFFTFGMYDEQLNEYADLEEAVDAANETIAFEGDDAQGILIYAVGDDGIINEVYEEDVNEDGEPTWKLSPDHSDVNTSLR